MSEVAPSDLASWLSPLSPGIVDAVTTAARVVGPRSLDIGLDPVGSIRALRRDLDAVAPGDRVAWLVEQVDPGALSVVELQALFGEIGHLEALDVSACDRTGQSRCTVVCRRREDVVGVVLRLPEDERDLRRTLGVLRRTPGPVALLAMTAPQAQGLSPRLRRRLRSVLRARRAGLLLLVPVERTDIALADLAGEAEQLVGAAGDAARVRSVCFEDAASIVTDARFGAAVQAASIDVDLSLLPAGAPGDNRAHLFGGAYIPQPFDQRSPSARADESRPVELVRHVLPSLPLQKAVTALNHQRRGWALTALGRRLSFRRRERYFQRAADSLDLQQRYHEFLAYNWLPQEPATRVWAVDLGSAEIRRIRALSRAWTRVDSSASLVGHEALLDAALADARARIAPSLEARLEEQRSFHDYLASMPMAGPLRQDVHHFVDFLPAELGTVVEVGSGFGRLAYELGSRASNYITLDLSFNAQRAVRRAGGTIPVVGDMHRLPIVSASLDAVVANNSLEHLYDPSSGLAEVARVLKPGGRLLALIPLELLGPDHDLPAHLWKTDELGIRSAVDAAGLNVRRLDVVDIYGLGVAGSFPSCRGMVAELEAVR